MRRTTVLLSAGDCWGLSLASSLAAREQVTAVLLDRCAAAARPSHPRARLVADALAAGVEVLVDTGALERRGIATTDLADGLKPTDLEAVGDLLADATDKVMWL